MVPRAGSCRKRMPPSKPCLDPRFLRVVGLPDLLGLPAWFDQVVELPSEHPGAAFTSRSVRVHSSNFLGFLRVFGRASRSIQPSPPNVPCNAAGLQDFGMGFSSGGRCVNCAYGRPRLFLRKTNWSLPYASVPYPNGPRPPPAPSRSPWFSVERTPNLGGLRLGLAATVRKFIVLLLSSSSLMGSS